MVCEHNKTSPQVLLAAFLDDCHWSRGNNNGKFYLGKPCPKPCGYFGVRGQLSLREALLSWWPLWCQHRTSSDRAWRGADTEADGGFGVSESCALTGTARPQPLLLDGHQVPGMRSCLLSLLLQKTFGYPNLMCTGLS